MVDPETTFGVRPDKIARLFAIGREAFRFDDVDVTEQKTNLLQDFLAHPMASFTEGIAFSSDGNEALALLSGKSIGHLLLEASTPLPIIMELKRTAKRYSDTARSPVQRHALNVVYYLAIAQALVFHRCLLSTHSFKHLAESFQRLKGERWIPSDIQSLFSRAIPPCVDSSSQALGHPQSK